MRARNRCSNCKYVIFPPEAPRWLRAVLAGEMQGSPLNSVNFPPTEKHGYRPHIISPLKDLRIAYFYKEMLDFSH